MAYDVSAFAQTAIANIIQGYDEGNYLADLQGSNPFGYEYVYEKGKKTWRYPVFAARSVGNVADSASSDLSGSSATETKIDVTCDLPLKVNDYVLYSDVNDFGGFIPPALAARFGRDIGQARADRIAAFVAAQAIAGDSAGNRKITQALSADADVATGLGTLIAQYQADKIPLSGITILVKPSAFQRLIRSSAGGSSDWGQKGTVGMVGDREYSGCHIRPCASIMGLNWTNTTTYTNVASKYRGNFSNVWAIAFQREALVLVESEKIGEATSIVEVPEREGWLIRARCEFGTGELQPLALKCIVTS